MADYDELFRYSDCTHDDANLTCNGELLCANCGEAV